MQIATRSESKKMLKSGRIRINGEVIRDGAVKCDPNKDQISVDDQPIDYQEFHYIMLHKPAGCVTATEDSMHKTVMDYLPGKFQKNMAPVGRLDKDTEGLLLITDDGALTHDLLSPTKHVAKTYEATIRGIVMNEEITAFANGLSIGEKKPTAPAILEICNTNPQTGESQIRVTITEGKFHQIKRMFHAVGMEVLYLKRISMGPLFLDAQLAPGQWRELTNEEIQMLKERKPC